MKSWVFIILSCIQSFDKISVKTILRVWGGEGRGRRDNNIIEKYADMEKFLI